MLSFILIADSLQPPDLEKLMNKLGPVQVNSDGEYFVKRHVGEERDWIAAQRADETIEEFDAEELELVKKSITTPCFVAVSWGGQGPRTLGNEFILALENPETLLIDNDSGLIVSAKEIQDRIRAGKDWLYSEK